MFADRQIAYFHDLRAQTNNLMIPFEYVINFPVQLINEFFDNLETQRSLARDNAQLREQLLFMRADMQKMIAVQNENVQLKELLQASAKAGGKVLQAQILAVSPSPFLNQIIIDKGSLQGVYVGQPVLDAYGVMGQVIQVGLVSSRILLLTDNMSAIPVQDTRSAVRAIAMGGGSLNMLRIHNVTQTMDMKVGDLLITSGLDQRYPYGYPVGTIAEVKLDPAGQFLNIKVTPAARLNRSRLVLLVWPNKIPVDASVQQGMVEDEKNRTQQAATIMESAE